MTGLAPRGEKWRKVLFKSDLGYWRSRAGGGNLGAHPGAAEGSDETETKSQSHRTRSYARQVRQGVGSERSRPASVMASRSTGYVRDSWENAALPKSA